MFTLKWLYRPGKSNVADPLSRGAGVVAAVLPVFGSELLCSYTAVDCQGVKEQLTFRWGQSTVDYKASSPVHQVKASVAAATHS